MYFVIAVLLGILLGILVPYNLSSNTLPYVAVAIIAALDSVFGGLSANLNKRFDMNVFMMGLFSNAVLAVLLTYMGNLLGISLYFAVIVVFGVRIFNNLATIRRMTFDIYFAKRAAERRRHLRLAISERAESLGESSSDAEDMRDKDFEIEADEGFDENSEADETKDDKSGTEKSENDGK